MSKLTLTSLFDGSGGFPLAGLLSGITPIQASEVEPFPIRVTTKRLPHMKHLGNVSKINGAEITPTDLVSFGSPCQDLSIAGRRAGLDGKRSGLFMEAVRIIKEMREATDGRYPTFVVWENVMGAISSNKGEDFKTVLEEIIGIVEPGAEVPAPNENKWPYADLYLGDGWSVAYRTLDAQYWGTAQRRRRIFLVADFAGERAGDILFESDSLPRYSPQSGSPWQGTAGGVAGCIGEPIVFEPGIASRDGGHVWQDGKTGTIRANMGDNQIAVVIPIQENKVYSFDSLGSNSMKSANPHSGCREVDTAKTLDTTIPDPSKNQGGVAVLCAGFNEHKSASAEICYNEEKTPCIEANMPPNVLCAATQQGGAEILEDKCPTITASAGMSGNNQPYVCAVENHPADSRVKLDESGTIQTLTERMGTGGGNVPLVMNERQYALTVSADVANTLTGTDYKGTQCVFELKAFTQNQREEVRDLGDKAGALAAEPGAHQQTYVLQGNMIGRADKNGPQGCGVNEDVSFTLTEADRHAVAYSLDRAAYNQEQNAQYDISVQEEQAQTLVARGPHAVSAPCQNYAVRRLTPTECALLQGFPPNWCAELETINPTDEEIDWWFDVFETHRKIIGKSSKPKSRKQIKIWLQSPRSDAAEYKMWGNGVALPCVRFIMAGIVWVAKNETGKGNDYEKIT